MENKYNTNYNHCSDKLQAIEALGVQQTRWNNIQHDLYGNQQKLYCHLKSGEEVVLKCEFFEDSALITVNNAEQFKGIGERSEELINPVLEAIRTKYPDASVVGDEKFIRVIF